VTEVETIPMAFPIERDPREVDVVPGAETIFLGDLTTEEEVLDVRERE
jgi:hypothetical protein